MDSTDLAIIGAGPAGLAAAATVAGTGASVVLLDEQPLPGGQIYRGVEMVQMLRPKTFGFFGPEFAAGADLAKAVRGSAVDYRPGSVVWDVSPDLVLHYSRDGRSRGLAARHVLIASGALERPVPIPGWTLPGVMTVGALQILLKADALVPRVPAVLAGAGPLLLLLAVQYLRAGAPPTAIVETVPKDAYRRSARHLPQALRGWRSLLKGRGWMRDLARAGVPWYRGCTGLGIEGGDRAEALAFDHDGGRRRIAADVIALHQGVVPNTQLTRLVGCAHDWDSAQRCFRPRLDAWLASTVEGIWVAGDGGGIAGAKAAEWQGRLAGLAIAGRLGRLDERDRDRQAAPLRTALARELAVRPLLDALYHPSPEVLCPADDVIVCRCEEVTAGRVREAVRLGCPGPNQAKSFLRCGMGPCQGRLCGLTVTEIIARERGLDPAEIGSYRIRPPLKPLPLAELAALDDEAEAPV